MPNPVEIKLVVGENQGSFDRLAIKFSSPAEKELFYKAFQDKAGSNPAEFKPFLQQLEASTTDPTTLYIKPSDGTNSGLYTTRQSPQLAINFGHTAVRDFFMSLIPIPKEDARIFDDLARNNALYFSPKKLPTTVDQHVMDQSIPNLIKATFVTDAPAAAPPRKTAPRPAGVSPGTPAPLDEEDDDDATTATKGVSPLAGVDKQWDEKILAKFKELITPDKDLKFTLEPPTSDKDQKDTKNPTLAHIKNKEDKELATVKRNGVEFTDQSSPEDRVNITIKYIKALNNASGTIDFTLHNMDPKDIAKITKQLSTDDSKIKININVQPPLDKEKDKELLAKIAECRPKDADKPAPTKKEEAHSGDGQPPSTEKKPPGEKPHQ